jgi:hypothetical protein
MTKTQIAIIAVGIVTTALVFNAIRVIVSETIKTNNVVVATTNSNAPAPVNNVVVATTNSNAPAPVQSGTVTVKQSASPTGCMPKTFEYIKTYKPEDVSDCQHTWGYVIDKEHHVCYFVGDQCTNNAIVTYVPCERLDK